MVYERVYELVRLIPKGKVLTYGMISRKLEGRLSAQAVGWALRALPSKDGLYDSDNVPWHRVINASGGISTTGKATSDNADTGEVQKKLLRKEGIKLNEEGKVDLDVYLWTDFYGCDL